MNPASFEAVDYKIPRYLFRVTTSESRSLTSHSEIASWAWSLKESSPYVPFLDCTYSQAKKMIEDHLLWRYLRTDDLTSFTSSFLFAIQHAIRYERQKLNTNICVWIIDTHKLARRPFFPASYLLTLFDIADDGKLRHESFPHEYLLVGHIGVQGCIDMIAFDDILHRGLHVLVPYLDDAYKDYLQRAISQIRWNEMREEKHILDDELDLAWHISVLIGEERRLPFFLSLLSFSKRPVHNPWMVSYVQKNFLDYNLGLCFFDSWDKTLQNAVMREVIQYRKLAKELFLHHERVKAKIEAAAVEAVVSESESESESSDCESLRLTSLTEEGPVNDQAQTQALTLPLRLLKLPIPVVDLDDESTPNNDWEESLVKRKGADSPEIIFLYEKPVHSTTPTIGRRARSVEAEHAEVGSPRKIAKRVRTV